MATLAAPTIVAFLEHLQTERQCGPRTCNQRLLAAIHAFARYVQGEAPDCLLAMQRILAIPPRRFARKPVAYLEAADLGAVLAQPDATSSTGRRDAVLLSVLYDTGARCQELLDLRVKHLRLDAPAQVRLTGKGRKTRIVPLMASISALLRGILKRSDSSNPTPLIGPSSPGATAPQCRAQACVICSPSTFSRRPSRGPASRAGSVHTRSGTAKRCTCSRLVCRS